MPKKFYVLIFSIFLIAIYAAIPFFSQKNMSHQTQQMILEGTLLDREAVEPLIVEEVGILPENIKEALEMNIYSARDVLNIEQGTATVWVKFRSGFPDRGDHLIFQTDDSRLALFIDTYYSSGMEREIMRLGARAGGNRRFNDPGSNFPEASIIIDNTGALESYRHAWYSPVRFPQEEWHCVAMTWQGYPEGIVKIYFDGALKGQKPYSQNYDDGRPLFEKYSVGYRPPEWVGELTAGLDLRPITQMSLQSGGIEIRDLKFYQECLSDAQIQATAEQQQQALF